MPFRPPQTARPYARRPSPAHTQPFLLSRSQAARRFNDLKASYHAHRRPLSVSFRDLANDIPVGERLTHRLHSYPATLFRSIPAFFLAVPELAPDGITVGDPFCGSGTVLVEAMSAGFDSYGLDVNPLATLISRVKTRPLDPRQLATMHRQIVHQRDRYQDGAFEAPPVVNIQHWFYPHVIRQLAQICAALQTLPAGRYLDFFRVCFSSCVRRVSLANPRVSVPVRLRPDAYSTQSNLHDILTNRLHELRNIDVWEVFSQAVNDNRIRVAQLYSVPTPPTSTVRTGDIRTWSSSPFSREAPLPRCSLMITSPPYLSAQKYVRATSLSLNWLRLTPPNSLRALERNTIGREHINKDEYISFAPVPRTFRPRLAEIARINPLRAQITAHYIADLRRFFEQLPTWLTPEAHCVLVIGPNSVCGRIFDTPGLVVGLAREYGFSLTLELLDRIRSRGLMTRRHRGTPIIRREHVLLFKRTGR